MCPLRKTWLSTWWQNPCWQSQRSDVSCSWPPGLRTSQEGFCPTPLCGSSSIRLASSWSQRAGFWSHLTTTLSPSSPLNHWQTSDGPVHVLSWAGGPCRRCMISVFHGVVLPIVFLVTMVPAALRSLTRSSRLDLGWFLTVLMIIETPRGEILHGVPVRGRLTVILCFFHLRIIAPTVVSFSPSCLAMVWYR